MSRSFARGRIALASLLAAALSLVATVGAAAQEEPAPLEPTAIVGIVDTGINPYHITFRDDSPRAYQHPSTYLPGYPADAVALPLTFDAASYAAAVKKDCEGVWKNVVPGKTYWFPGTKIVGAVSTEPATAVNCKASGLPTGIKILDYGGHGTMTASRATSNEYGACRDCRVVAIQFPGSVNLVSPSGSTAPTIAAIKWAADNAGWLDMQSNSWGPIVPLWEPTGQAGLLTSSPALVREVERVSSIHPAFWASGNGAAFRGGVIGHPTLLSPHMGPSAIIVGGHDSGYVNVWPGFPPHVVSDSCNAWAAAYNHLTQSGDSIAGGTSGATPYVAGGSARLLLEARRILSDTRTGVRAGGVIAEGPAGLVASGPLADGKLTMAELKDVTFKTATARPVRQFEDGPPCSGGVLYDATPVQWKDVPAEYPEFLHIGYGAVDAPAVTLGTKVLRGEAAMPVRTRTDAYFAADAAARSALHVVFRGGPGA